MADQQSPTGKMTREEVLQWIRDRAEELGAPPRREDLPEDILELILLYFDKWVYALEEAGLRTPSERTLARRAHRRDSNRASRKKRRKRSRSDNNGEEDNSD